MAVVETKVTWFSRIKDSFKGIIVGLLFLVGGVVLLYWNEGRTVTQRNALNEGQNIVVSVTEIDQSNEGALIHTSNDLVSDQDLNYSVLSINEPEGLKFKIKKEVYQWTEDAKTTTEEKVGGSQVQKTEYTYRSQWSESMIDSSSFEGPEKNKYVNMFVQYSDLGLTEMVAVDQTKMGDFLIAGHLFGQANEYSVFQPTEEIVNTLTQIAKQGYGGKYKVLRRGDNVYLQQKEGVDTVGDVRVSFGLMKEQPASVIGKQEGNIISSYYTSNDTDISMMSIGTKSAETMFQEAHAANELMKWVMRLIGFLLIYGGFSMLFRPLVVLADVLPILGSIVGAGTSLISFLLAVAVRSVTVAIAWIRFRPVLGVSLLVVAAASLGGLWYVGKKNRGKNNNEEGKMKNE